MVTGNAQPRVATAEDGDRRPGSDAQRSVRERAARNHALWVSAAALVIQVVVLNLPGSLLGGDIIEDYEGTYRTAAENLIDGRGLTDLEGDPAVLTPPGFPLLLAGVFSASDVVGLSRPAGVTVLIVLTMAASCAVVFVIARRLFSKRVAWFAAALWITYPPNLLLSSGANVEVPFILLFYLAVLVFLVATQDHARSAWPYVAVGVLVGGATLVRPIGAAIGVILAGLIFRFRKDISTRSRASFAAALIAANLLVLVPWEVWAWSKTHTVVPLGTLGPASVVDGLTFGIRDDESRVEVPRDVEALMADAAAKGDSLDSMSSVAGFMASQAVERPAAVAKLAVIKATRSWYGTNSGNHESQIAILQVPYLLLAGWGMVLAWRARHRRIVVLVGILTLYFWAMTISALPIARYTVPVIGLLLLFTALAVEHVTQRLRKETNRAFDHHPRIQRGTLRRSRPQGAGRPRVVDPV